MNLNKAFTQSSPGRGPLVKQHPREPNDRTWRINSFRRQASFNTELLTEYLFDGPQKLKERRETIKRVQKALGLNDTWKLPPIYGSQNREQQYEYGVACGRVEFEDGLKYGHEVFHKMTNKYDLANASPFGMQFTLFVPAIRYMASDEQQAVWLPLAEKGQMLGTYVQIGHGTAVQNIETTATHDPACQEFIIHSPTTSSTKCWPDALGLSTTHAIVMARLITKGRDHGPLAFMVPIRDPSTGKPMPGMELGDVGSKMDYTLTDNGYCRFDKVRIPRTNLLMRHVEVLPDGTFRKVKGANSKSIYSAMLDGRGVIINWAGFQLAMAVTIATRFSVVRVQGQGPNNLLKNETPIFEYKQQHYRLLTLLAKAYMIHFMKRYCQSEIKKHFDLMLTGDHSMAQWNHALSSGFKAWATTMAADAAEDASRACGGHGFHNLSGLPHLVGSLTAGVTFEGENQVLFQQVFRYLLKCLGDLDQGREIVDQLAYLKEGHAKHWIKQHYVSKHYVSRHYISKPRPGKCVADMFLKPNIQLALSKHRALRQVYGVAAALEKSRKAGRTEAESWNKHMLSIIEAAKSHIEYQILETAYCSIRDLPKQYKSELEPVLTRLASLFALTTIIGSTGFYEDDNLTKERMDDIRECIDVVLEALHPDAIALTDAWDFTDATLASAIGCKDGNAYERLLNWIRQVPINEAARANGGMYKDIWEREFRPVVMRGREKTAKARL